MNIVLTTIILFVVFGVLLFMGVPISVSIIVSSIVTAMSTLSWDQITFITMQKMNSGIESFSLLAVPLFILAGNIMNNGGIAKRLVNFAQLFVGKLPGNLAQANILGNMLFGALSGSSVAAASAMGGCISPIEKEQEYDPAYSAAANIASAPTGLLIPPTSAFIVYSTVAGGVSISTLFMAGYVPGILMGLGCMVVAFIYAKKWVSRRPAVTNPSVLQRRSGMPFRPCCSSLSLSAVSYPVSLRRRKVQVLQFFTASSCPLSTRVSISRDLWRFS